jgi:hypothetical protein
MSSFLFLFENPLVFALAMHQGGTVDKVERISMSGKDLKRFRVIQDLLKNKITQVEAAEELGLSTRQVRRIFQEYKAVGIKSLAHGLTGKRSNRALSPLLYDEIKALWENQYRDAGFNMSHFTDKVREVHNLSIGRETIRRLLRAENMYSRKKKRGRKHRSYRERKECYGELLQQDTSTHDWLGTGVKYHCIVVVDDATSSLLYCRLFEHDGTLPNLSALLDVFRQNGLPHAVYTDKAAWFHPNEKKSVVETFKAIKDEPIKEYESQIGRALKELGVEFIAAHSPQAKGRVERANGTLQDRLIAELCLRKITNLEIANHYITNIFIKDYNARFAKKPQSPEEAFIKLTKAEVLNEILCIKLESKVQNDNTISNAKFYKIQLLPTANRLNWAQAKVVVRIMPDMGVIVRYKQTHEIIPNKILELKIPKEFKYKAPDLADTSTG